MNKKYEIGACVDNAVHELEQLGGKGRIIFDDETNHAYTIPDSAQPNDLAINPPVKVVVKGEEALVNFPDMTRQQLEDKLREGKAVDKTKPGSL